MFIHYFCFHPPLNSTSLKKASETNLKGILRFEELPLVSIDFMGMRPSSCVDAALTNQIDDTVKVVAWYDNEAGYSNKLIDLSALISSM